MTEEKEKEKWIEEVFNTFDVDWELFGKDEAFHQVSRQFIALLESGNEFYRTNSYKAALVHYDEAVKVFKGNFPVNERF